MRENAMIMERLVDSLLVKILGDTFDATNGEIKNFVLKFGHSEDEPWYELKYDMYFDDVEAFKVFEDAWLKLTSSVMDGVKSFDLSKAKVSEEQWASLWTKNGKSFKFPFCFEQPDELDNGFCTTGTYHWNNEDTEEFNKLMILAKVAKSMGYLEGNLTKTKELKLFKQGIEWGTIEFSI